MEERHKVGSVFVFPEWGRHGNLSNFISDMRDLGLIHPVLSPCHNDRWSCIFAAIPTQDGRASEESIFFVFENEVDAVFVKLKG